MNALIKSVELSEQVVIPYVEQGDPSGVPVVLLHGFAGSWRSFQRLLPLLPDSIHTFAITQRGHGDASHPDTGYRPQNFAHDLAAFLDALKLPSAVIVGHSMGSAVSQRFAIDRPKRTQGLVLISARASMQERPGLLDLWESTISKLSDPVDPEFVRSFVENAFVQPLPEDFLEISIRDALSVPAHVWRQAFKVALETNLIQELDRIQAPTLLVWGAEDATVPENDRDAISAAITNSQKTVYAGVGHGPHAEHPKRLAKDLVAFIQKNIK